MFLQRDLGTSVPMRLYTMKKCYFVVVTVIFFLIIGCSVIFGLVGPNVSNSVIVSSSNRPSITSLEASVYQVDSPSLSVFHRELWLSAIINRAPLEQNAKVSVNINISIQVQIPYLATAGSRSAMFKSDPNYKTPVVQMGPIHNRTVQVNCPDTKCDELFLFHLIPVDFTIYKFRVKFYHELPNDHLTYKDYEGKHLLFKITNPLYPLQYLTINWFPSCLDYLFQITFVAVLLLVWLCIFHGIRISKRTFQKFYLPKICLISMFWLIIFLIITWKVYVEHHEPVFDILEYTNLLIFTVVFISLFGFIYVVLFTVLFIRACHKLRKLPYFNLRLYFLTFQSIIFIIVLGFACLIHFNGRLLLSQSMNYVRNVKDGISKMTAQQKNSQNNIGLQHRFNDILEMDVKDDPSLSMINDSDEDVIYE
ncbi:hypothetical protein Smp_149370 [Schistosoma mansoni]|uniref:hypothetical protein n=1 Tax=Schistosoma mansoni TaxID=6183 RepID=UPI0001A63F0C|nr:hypothetical protein Smp_149370 [Schistosoma mansoni]|eukprot:XP_018653295.1 hypothetical protein Smp_149370 [Schistosoma mansoni]